MPLTKLLFLFALAVFTAAAGPLTVDFEWDFANGVGTFAIDGPRGLELHNVPCCPLGFAVISLQNDRWQLIVYWISSILPRHFLINYGQGPGTYEVFPNEIARWGSLSDVNGDGIEIPAPVGLEYEFFNEPLVLLGHKKNILM